MLRPPARERWAPPGPPEAGRASTRSEASADQRTEIPHAAQDKARKLNKLPLLGLPLAVQVKTLAPQCSGPEFKPWLGIQSSQAAHWEQTEKEGSGPAGTELRPLASSL